MTWNTKIWVILFAVVLVTVLTGAVWAFGQPPQEQRGPMGFFNWKQTNTYPSMPWPSIPTQHTNAICLTSDTTDPGKYPPSGTTGAAAVAAAPVRDWTVAALVAGGGLVGGFLLLGGGGQLAGDIRTARTRRGSRK